MLNCRGSDFEQNQIPAEPIRHRPESRDGSDNLH
jgi:hypothetical protein